MSKTSNKALVEHGRRVAYDFTGCLAHVEVTREMDTGNTLRIFGIFDHNDECLSAKLRRIPAIPLHEDVYAVALSQLRNGAGLVFHLLFL